MAHTDALPMISVVDSGTVVYGETVKAWTAAKKRRRLTLTPCQTSAIMTSPSIPLVPPDALSTLNAVATDTATTTECAKVQPTARTMKTMSTLMMKTMSTLMMMKTMSTLMMMKKMSTLMMMISHPLLMTAAPLTR